MQPDHNPDAHSIVSDSEFWRNLPVHPAAEMLPMTNDEEIKELAADIEKNGLREPVDVFVDNREEPNGAQPPFPPSLLDGRNRLAALKLLGVIPMICRGEVRVFHDLISKLKEIYGAELDVGRELLRMRGRHMSNGARMVGL